MSVRRRLAEYYYWDAHHFLQRYGSLRPEDFNKAGRVKNFVDVLLAAECALKAHVLLGRSTDDAVALYRQLRRMSHNVAALADRADYLDDRLLYDAVKEQFGGLSVSLRYSLDMWESYFPGLAAVEGARGPEEYDATVGNSAWRDKAVTLVRQLLRDLLSPRVLDDFDDFFRAEEEMAEFVRSVNLLQ
jgi:hypothetical protein